MLPLSLLNYVTESSFWFCRPDERLPRANKRFLSAIIRNTDEHNKAILRAQAETAQEARARKEEEERIERRARAKEATEAERLRRLMGSSRRRDDNSDRWENRKRRSSRERLGDEKSAGSNSHRKRKHRSHSKSPPLSESDSGRPSNSSRHRDDDRVYTRHNSHSISKDPADRDRKRTHKVYDDDEPPRRRRRRSKSGSASPGRDNSLRPRPLESTYNNEHEGKEGKMDKGKAVDRTSLNSDSLPSRGQSLKISDSAGDDVERTVSSKSSRRHSRSLERTNSPSSSRPSPRPADLSSQFKSRKSVQVSPVPPASPTLSEEEDIMRLRPRRHQRKLSEKTSRDGKKASRTSLPTSRSPSPEFSSKMDKYFDASYDPRLDTGPLTLPNIPSSGLIDGSEFEGWEAMLEVVRQRREDRAERKRLERLGILPDDKVKKEKKALQDSGAWTMDAGVSVLDIKYSKRGAVREWDMGK